MSEINLDDFADEYLLLRVAKERQDEAIKEYERRKARFRALVGDHKVAKIQGEEVITNNPINTFRGKEFRDEHPLLAKEYTRVVAKDELDVEALKADHPAVWERYRSRQFLIKEV